MARPLTPFEWDMLRELHSHPGAEAALQTHLAAGAARGDRDEDVVEDLLAGWLTSKISLLAQEYAGRCRARHGGKHQRCYFPLFPATEIFVSR